MREVQVRSWETRLQIEDDKCNFEQTSDVCRWRRRWLASITASGWALTGLTVVHKQVMAAAMMENLPARHSRQKDKSPGQRKGAKTKADYLADKHAYI